MTRPEGRYPPQRVVPYDPGWPARYTELEERLRSGVGSGREWRFEHAGSTSVPGMPGKPVIDVAIGLPAGASLDAARELLVGLGWDGWVPLSDHWVTYLHEGGVRAAIAHVYTDEQWETADLRVFAAWLRAHPGDRDAYAATKLQLVDAGVWGQAYTAGKAALVQALTDRAHGRT